MKRNRGVRMWRDVGVVRRSRVATSDFSALEIHVDAQNPGKQIFGDRLAVIQGIVAIPLVADGDVEVSVRAEMHIAAVMVAGVVRLVD